MSYLSALVPLTLGLELSTVTFLSVPTLSSSNVPVRPVMVMESPDTSSRWGTAAFTAAVLSFST